MEYDLLLRGGYLVDPARGREGRYDVAVTGGKVSAVEEEIDPARARETVDVTHLTVIPGVIDGHVHLTGIARDRSVGHKMMARAGVTTAIDFGVTDMDDLAKGIVRNGAGLNVGGLFTLIPGATVPDENPDRGLLEERLEHGLQRGALGLKLLGGHFPLTPEATAATIAICNAAKAYVGYHIGTTASGSHLLGMRELPELLGDDGRVHVAHISAYCRGMIVDDPVQECLEALAILEGLRPRVVSESHLFNLNSTSGTCDGDVVTDHVTRNCLRMKGYTPDREGLRQALANGDAAAQLQVGDDVEYLWGRQALDLWEGRDTEVGVSFEVTPPVSAFMCTTRRDPSGRFIVDAIASDGGGIPRNVNVQRGFALVRFGALTRAELVEKLSANPARMFGLVNKGHLGPGADADITVVDESRGEPVMSFVGGRRIMARGQLFAQGATVLVTEAGVDWARANGLPYDVVDTSASQLYAS